MTKDATVTSPPPVEHEVGNPTTEPLDTKAPIGPPRFVKVRFPDKRSRVEGVYRLMRQTRVVCLPNDEFVIARSELSVLEEGDIPHEVLEEASLDEALAALRDSAAPLL